MSVAAEGRFEESLHLLRTEGGGQQRLCPGAYSTLQLYGSQIYVRAALKMYVLFPFVLSPVPCYEDVAMQAVPTITLSAETV